MTIGDYLDRRNKRKHCRERMEYYKMRTKAYLNINEYVEAGNPTRVLYMQIQEMDDQYTYWENKLKELI